MTDVTPELLEKNIEQVLKLTGQDSFLNWTDFEASSKKIVQAVETLNRQIAVFREAQQIYFISNLKKMKGADLPDMFKSVKANKMHIKALKPILNKFKLNGEQIELVDNIDNLKKEAAHSLTEYTKNNTEIAESFQTLTNFIKQRIVKYDIKAELLTPSKIDTLQKHELRHKFEESDVQNVCTNINMTYIPGTDGLIGLKTYVQIVDASVTLSTNQFINITKQSRTKQRTLLEKPKQYLQAMQEYLINSESLMTDAQLSVALKLGVSLRKFEQTETLLMQRGLGNNLLAAQTIARSQMRQKLKASKGVSMEQSLEIITYQIELIKTKADYISDIINNFPKSPESVQLIPMLLTFVLNDLVYQKYEIEEEDFMTNVNEKAIQTNPQLLKLFQEMETAILEFMQKLGVIPENFNEQALMGVPQGPQGGNQKGQQTGGILPGLLPGADPLAYQQMQAQIQMMNKKK